MLENLKELVAINSYKNSDQIIEYLKNRFINVASEIMVVSNKENNNKSLLIGLNTKLKDIEPIVLSGHIDTVAPDYDKYSTNPLELTKIGDRMYGLGSIDMKSFVAQILDNLNKLKSISAPIVISLTTDEETDLICVENVINKFEELNIRPKFTLVGEPTMSAINNCANGCFEFEVEVFGKACHSSIPEQGINAINIAAKLITFIEIEQNRFEGLTSNCGVVSGGDIVNRVPDYCKLKFDIRSTNLKMINQFIDLVNENIFRLGNEYSGANIVINKLLEIPPLQAKNMETIKQIAEKLNLKMEKFTGGCEAGYYQALNGDSVIFGVGDMSLAHKPNEYVEIEEYKKYGKLFLRFISEICEMYY